MEDQQYHTIHFVYDVHDHSLKFPMKADVQCTAPGIYTVTNIRLSSEDEGSLLPPMQLGKKNGQWLILDNNQQSNLGTTIGNAIDEGGIRYL
ncbi:MAG TPA: hypothetical protein VGS79_03175 [Puia sp.]|nr:hypothetical protein [Puia sp.]